MRVSLRIGVDVLAFPTLGRLVVLPGSGRPGLRVRVGLASCCGLLPGGQGFMLLATRASVEVDSRLLMVIIGDLGRKPCPSG